MRIASLPAGPPPRRAANASRVRRTSRAVKAALPAALEPQLATLAAAPPAAGRWLVENKFDGYRILARIERGQARLLTRGGHDWTDRMKSLAAQVQKLGLTRPGWTARSS